MNAKKGFQWVTKKKAAAEGAIEVLLILMVMIAIVVLFRDQITALANIIFADMFTKAQGIFQ